MAGPGQGRPHFQDQMRELEDSMLGALDMSLAQLDRVIDAMRGRDVRLAQFVVSDDARIDGRYLEVHQGVLSLLALQAPVAGDLRLVVAVLHVINNIERVGDQCANIAKLIPLAGADTTSPEDIERRILRMGALTHGELAQARHAFAARDVAVAESLAAQDEEVNRLNREIFRLAVEAGEEPQLREWAISMTLAARAFERIGDLAVDIGEQAIFVATGQFRELATGAGTVEGR
ncbi:MAG TPA: phosphate signaling complex protein PhoU [Solirubrobacteraceae bacterium]|jgi:phosphate transport system protein|nr:phosphate signaling complex protein PhoU [Solirubrobacteraceae bacterium]